MASVVRSVRCVHCVMSSYIHCNIIRRRRRGVRAKQQEQHSFQQSLSRACNSIIPFPATSSGRRRESEDKERRVVVTRAGLTTTNLIFAFVFPLSLILVTVFTSIRIADKLDQDYLQELANNQAMMEGEDSDESSPTTSEEKPKPAVPSKRNRPKRVA